ncbi:MAG: NADH-quinone oxidoreductase subunit K [Euryarchaeota archaeon RBG_16_62_10]|nr:MAG: NADH-quinone oxidoreductase subunit K [Euryarchaeota archaeon RBG_16_62_10]
MIPIEYWIIFSSLLFAIGAYGVLTRKNAIVVLMSIEVMLNAANINLVAFSSYHSALHPSTGPDASGQVFALFSIAIAAAEVAVGLAILLSVYRRYQTIDVDKINILRW